jgi:hypothetical protein
LALDFLAAGFAVAVDDDFAAVADFVPEAALVPEDVERLALLVGLVVPFFSPAAADLAPLPEALVLSEVDVDAPALLDAVAPDDFFTAVDVAPLLLLERLAVPAPVALREPGSGRLRASARNRSSIAGGPASTRLPRASSARSARSERP